MFNEFAYLSAINWAAKKAKNEQTILQNWKANEKGRP